jgi:hypothetical protein
MEEILVKTGTTIKSLLVIKDDVPVALQTRSYLQHLIMIYEYKINNTDENKSKK